MPKRQTYTKNEVTSWPIPNYWDLVALVLVLAILCLLGWGAKGMMGVYHLGQKLPISLSPTMLPYYALRTVCRMFIAMFCSLVFTFVFGTWAAKSRHAERLIIPLIDIAQSVPVLGFLTVAVANLTAIFQGSLLGPELASIFAIFTAQVWNMTLSFYQSLKTVPTEMREAAAILQLSAWQKFWRLEVPFAMPGLLWNAMMSMSGSWVYLIASGAITVANQTITLPGLGSYMWLAMMHADMRAEVYVIITMFIVIALYDQLLFRPLVAWSEKFRAGDLDDDTPEPSSWLLHIFQRTAFFQRIGAGLSRFGDWFVNFPLFLKHAQRRVVAVDPKIRQTMLQLGYGFLAALLIFAVLIMGRFIYADVPYSETWHILYLGAVTALRVMAVIVLSAVVWVPIGVWVGLNPKVSRVVQPIAQFLAAFPPNLLFPIFIIAIIRFHLNVDIWSSPLMILGTQWYILFNVVAGTTALPKNLRQAVDTLNVRGWLWWKRLILPGIFPYVVTGAITAAGGAWNMSIITEVLTWGHIHLAATGLGAYIAHMTTVGDFPREALGIVVMSLYVLAFNYLIWRPLYNLAEQRFQIQ